MAPSLRLSPWFSKRSLVIWSHLVHSMNTSKMFSKSMIGKLSWNANSQFDLIIFLRLAIYSVDRTKLFSSLDQLVKMKMYTIVFSILHCIRTQQQFSNKKLLATSLESTYYRKILKSALHQKEPQFYSKSDKMPYLSWIEKNTYNFYHSNSNSTSCHTSVWCTVRRYIEITEGWIEIGFGENELLGAVCKILWVNERFHECENQQRATFEVQIFNATSSNGSQSKGRLWN